jgi:hypothetical protein
MMACPILEDEMIYNLVTDSESKSITLVTNENNATLIPKMKKAGLDYKEISETDFKKGNLALPKDGYSVFIWMMSLGLHTEPEDLKKKVDDEMLSIDGMFDGILLYYGLCGQAFKGIDDWARENMKTPVTILKDAKGRICDDCICVPIDGTDNYYSLLKKYPGVMYLTPAIAINHDEFVTRLDLTKGLDESMKGYEFIKILLDMAGYKNSLIIPSKIGDQEHFLQEAQIYSDKLGLKMLNELDPSFATTAVADRSYAAAKAHLAHHIVRAA